jgi:hypothetical protein
VTPRHLSSLIEIASFCLNKHPYISALLCTFRKRATPRSQSEEQYFKTIPSLRFCSGYPTCYTPFTTASLYSSKDALDILNSICTPATVLFDPRFTTRQRPSPSPPFRTFPPSPALARAFFSVPSTISVRNLDDTEPPAEMDKRHPSSFQQLEKLGEGTYATVSDCGVPRRRISNIHFYLP